MKKIVSLFFLLTCCLSGSLSAQLKLEREYRIEAATVPSQALEFIEQLLFDRRIRWYREESLTGHTIEAKTRYNGQHYSIEFDSLGQIEDVEIKIRIQDLPASSQANITDYLNSQYRKYRIDRIQLQFSPSVEGPQQWEFPFGAPLIQRYELEVDVRTDSGFQSLELLFSATGELLQERRIIRRNTDNLEY